MNESWSIESYQGIGDDYEAECWEEIEGFEGDWENAGKRFEEMASSGRAVRLVVAEGSTFRVVKERWPE